MNLNTYMQAKMPEHEQPDPHPYNLIDLTGRALNALYDRRQELLAEVARLETLDPVDAKPHYRKAHPHGDPRYLYLVHPQKNGMRKREYIGADPEKQAAGLARIEAHKQLVACQRDLNAIETRLAVITRLLLRCLRVAIDGHTW